MRIITIERSSFGVSSLSSVEKRHRQRRRRRYEQRRRRSTGALQAATASVHSVELGEAMRRTGASRPWSSSIVLASACATPASGRASAPRGADSSDRDRQHEAEFAEQAAHLARQEGQRHEDGGKRGRRGDDGEEHLVRAEHGRRARRPCPRPGGARCSPAPRWRRRPPGPSPARWRAASGC